MSRITPPPPSTPSGSPNDPNKKPGQPAQKPNTTTPKAPEVGASAPPTAGGHPANKVVAPGAPRPGGTPQQPGAKIPGQVTPGSLSSPGAAGAGGGGGAGGGAGGAAGAGGSVPVEELKGRPLGRVLTKMGKVSREQVVEALNFQ